MLGSVRLSVTLSMCCRQIRFLPAGNLTLVVDRAKALTFPEAHKAAMNSGESLARMDPYVKLSLEGKVG